MNKGLKGLIIVGSIILGVGITVAAVGVATSGFNFSVFQMKYEEINKEITTDFNDVVIDETVGSITLNYYDGATTKVEIVENEYVDHDVEVVDGKLKITSKQVPHNWFLFKFGFRKLYTTVYLPKTEYGNFDIQTTTGSITVNKEFTLEQANIETTTGSVNFYADVNSDVSLKSTTGSVNINDAKIGNTVAKTTTGSINFKNCEVGTLKADVTTGSFLFENSTATSIDTNGDTGSIKLINSTLTGDLKTRRSTGSITFDRFDAANLDCKTTTGSIKGTLLSPKVFSAHTTTGSVNVPLSTTGGLAILETTTGSINITIA